MRKRRRAEEEAGVAGVLRLFTCRRGEGRPDHRGRPAQR